MMNENITLIGMPASGKSTVGVILAKIIGYDFVDTDILIQRRTGRRLRDLISSEGIDGFLSIENRVCRSLAAKHAVIATGGSAVYGEEGMERLKSIGIVVYLETAYDVLERRLHNIRRRGVIIREGQTLRDLYEERAPLYRKYADITISEEHGNSEQVVAGIVSELRRRGTFGKEWRSLT